jgi:putative ABC transport system permease protein
MPRVVILSNAFVKRYFNGQSPIGRTIQIGSTPVEVVGVVNDIQYSGPQEASQVEIYVDLRQFPMNGNIFGALPQRGYVYRRYIAVRTNDNPVSIIPIIRDILHQMDSQLRLDDVETMEERLSNSGWIARPRFFTVILALFALIALTLAVIGLYGVMTYSITQRTQEIGIRMALGARHRQVLWLVLRQGLAITIVGLGLGLSGAVAVTRYLESMLFGLAPLDTITYVAVSILFVSTATFASYLPARRVIKVDPLVALRYE